MVRGWQDGGSGDQEGGWVGCWFGDVKFLKLEDGGCKYKTLRYVRGGGCVTKVPFPPVTFFFSEPHPIETGN